MSDVRDEPLRPAVFHILLALASEELHGLGIAEAVEHATDGVVELGPGTLYRSLREMVDAGVIREAPAPEPGADPRRKYYRITGEGRAVLARDADRWARVVELARARRVLPERA